MHPLPLPSRGDDARVPQTGKMTTDLRLVRSQYFRKEADTNFVAAHQVQQPQPRVIGKRAKKAIHAEGVLLRHTREILSQNDICLDICPPGA